MIYIVTIFMVTRFIVRNITNKVKEKTCGPYVSFRNFFSQNVTVGFRRQPQNFYLICSFNISTI